MTQHAKHKLLADLQQANQGPFSNEAIQGIFSQVFRATLAMEEEQDKAKLLVQRRSDDEQTVVELPDGTKIGDGTFQLIAGPCAIESFEQADEVGAALAARGVKIMRGMAFKPRTSPYDFQGMGEEGLKIAASCCDQTWDEYG